MDIKKLTTKQKLLIRNKIKDNLDLKSMYKEYKDYFKAISFNKFQNSFIDYILNGCESEHFKVFDNYDFIENEQFYKLETFKDEIKDTDTDTLINYDSENEQFNNFEYLDYDFITEDLKLRLQNDNLNFIDNSRSNDLIININAINSILDNLEYYTFKEFLKDLDNLVYDYDLKNLYAMFIFDNHKKQFCIQSKLDFKGLNDSIIKEIKNEIKIREINLIQNITDIKTKLKKINILKCKKPLIIESINCFKLDLNNRLKDNKTELYNISIFLNPKLKETEIKI